MALSSSFDRESFDLNPSSWAHVRIKSLEREREREREVNSENSASIERLQFPLIFS